MDETNLPDGGAELNVTGTEAVPAPAAEHPHPHVKPAHLRALERASLRELRANERER